MRCASPSEGVAVAIAVAWFMSQLRVTACPSRLLWPGSCRGSGQFRVRRGQGVRVVRASDKDEPGRAKIEDDRVEAISRQMDKRVLDEARGHGGDHDAQIGAIGDDKGDRVSCDGAWAKAA